MTNTANTPAAATILADYPAFTVIALVEDADIKLTNDKGYARTSPATFAIKALKRDKYEYIRAFTIGCDGDDASKVWATGNGSMITAEARAKELRIGIELGQIIQIEGNQYTVEEDWNNNIKLTSAA